MTLMYSGITDTDILGAIRDTAWSRSAALEDIAYRLEIEGKNQSLGQRLRYMEKRGLVKAERCGCCGQKTKPVSYSLRRRGWDLLAEEAMR